MPDKVPEQTEADTIASTDQHITLNPATNQAALLVVGIGASAGGLEACRKLLTALPADSGMACILIQHLDPHHDSMMVDLLADHTSMVVRQATDGMPIKPGHLYIIPPGTYLSVAAGRLHLSQPRERHGARLPFDFLLHTLAADFGERSACVILSGTGADGSIGLKAVKEAGGLVIAQDPAEAGYSGMPRSAIMTGSVDRVLKVAQIPGALQAVRTKRSQPVPASPDEPRPSLLEIIELMRVNTMHDFRLYKPGTLERRIQRRMTMAAGRCNDMGQYIQMLRADPGELGLLAKDLLINVTGFFRDPQVFETLANRIIPEMVRSHAPDRPIRVWVAGCSTGEETYSLAMLFREAITAAKLGIKLQVFASDVDPDAIAIAREGLYPEANAADLSSGRIARFFSREDGGFRIAPELRAAVVFTVQDVLADPPFSRLDFVSCRNLLIYLRPEAQAKVLALFHFALGSGGILLLGTSETAGGQDGRFETVSKSDRIYRNTSRGRAGEFGLVRTISDGTRIIAKPGEGPNASRQAALAELCQRMVMETYAPAAALINRRQECLYTFGPTDQYLRVAPGHPSHDLLAMVRQGIRTKLRSAIHQASQGDARVVIPGGRTKQPFQAGQPYQAGQPSQAGTFSIAVQPVRHEGEDLMLVCFINNPKIGSARSQSGGVQDVSRVTELEQELEATRTELQGAIHNLEISGEDQKAINEEALSVQEEYQSTNEELLTSKEELQSLNEELTALNSQLQETLEKQQTTANDLQNVLYSTDVATLFLDHNLAIRFFTPATKALFAIIPSDLGRPLSDLNSLAADTDLLADARMVMRTLEPIEQEIEARNGACYIRRVLPYRTQDNGAEGVVITFADITHRRQVSIELNVAKRQAEQANAAKSRFLAAASHDLRQPLQTLTLVQGLLTKHVETAAARKLINRMDQTLGAMSGMLNALLDINQIETGTVHAEVTDFPVNDLLDQLRGEFAYHAQAKGLLLRVVPCSLSVRSDPRLLEQMIRNLVANALKYTGQGKVLLGCRRHRDMLRIEIWDTGIGVADNKLHAIFEEYNQINNMARERSQGLGLGLSIVQRLGALLRHAVHVRSWLGKGSIFSIDVPRSMVHPVRPYNRYQPGQPVEATGSHHTGVILVIEDDPDVRDLLEVFFKDDGHQVTTASDGHVALDLVQRGVVAPDLILSDYNLPHGLDGVRSILLLRKAMRRLIPSLVLTGDTSAVILTGIALADCVHITKPVKLKELAQAVQRLLPLSRQAIPVPPRLVKSDANLASPIIFVVDDDDAIRETIRAVLEDDGRSVQDFATGEGFLEAYCQGQQGCLVVDAYMPGMSGIALLEHLHSAGQHLPAIMITGNSDVAIAVQAMKAGASDFIEKPISRDDLLGCIDRAVEQARDVGKLAAWRADAASHIAALTARQRQIMDMVLAGHPSKNIAADLGISQRTVENHRASIMQKMGTRSLPALARLALTAERALPTD